MPDEDLLDEHEVAAVLRLPVSTLRFWRLEGKGKGPRHIKIGRRVRYPRDDVDAYRRGERSDDAPGGISTA